PAARNLHSCAWPTIRPTLRLSTPHAPRARQPNEPRRQHAAPGQNGFPMLLMIDNYDSFTFNLVQYLQALGAEVEVVRNDALSVEQIRKLAPERIVVSQIGRAHV